MTDAVMAETKYGFHFGPALVERLWSHKGYVCITVTTGIHKLNVQVTPSGQIKHIHSKHKRLKETV